MSNSQGKTERWSLKNLVLMKVGMHASEELRDIMKRKKREFQESGMVMWGYGGTICHPTTQVQPFLEKVRSRGEVAYLAMILTSSKMTGDPYLATSFSTDRGKWHKIPDGIEVAGSDKAIVCNRLVETDINIDLSSYEVAVGPSKGKSVENYFSGRVDKACATLKESPRKSGDNMEEEVNIHCLSKIISPYAVFLR